MILIDKSRGAAAVYLPMNGWKADLVQQARLALTSTIDRTGSEVSLESITLGGEFALVRFAYPEDIVAGEYEYSLAAGGNVISSGLLRVVESAVETIAFGAEVEYKQYGD